MKKVLIADDEFLVRVGLKTTINWEENGFQIVGEAKNGKEAIELFQKHDPDILLTDIRMPVMDGLELIQTLKKMKKNLKAVILTHYDDFGYAKEAIKHGASEYILKSDLSDENLLEVLKKLSEEIEAEGTSESQSTNKDIKESFNVELYMDDLLKQIVLSNIKSGDDLDQILTGHEKIFKYNSYVFFTFVLEDISGTSYEKDKELFLKTIKNILNQVFDEMYFEYSLFIENSEITCLLNVSISDDNAHYAKTIFNCILMFKKNLKQFLDIELSVGISEISNFINSLVNLLKQSRIAQKHCFFEPIGIVAFKEEMLMRVDAAPQINLEIVKGFVKVLSSEQIVVYIETIFTRLMVLKQIGWVKDIFIDFLSFAKIISNELNLKSEPALNETKFSYDNFDRLHSIDAVKHYIIDIYCSIVDYLSGKKQDKYSYIISKSINFIKQNYHKNIALTDAAEYLEISKSYLSLLFKQETGINFTAFLTNYRIETAKKLLVSSNYKIYEIAEKVGFENPYYFSKVFKEVTGITCKEFKRDAG
jgi:two-component system, response regulator YesN